MVDLALKSPLNSVWRILEVLTVTVAFERPLDPELWFRVQANDSYVDLDFKRF